VPQVGDRVSFEACEWQVVSVHPYEPTKASAIAVYEVWCSQDGSDYRRDWSTRTPHHLRVEAGVQGEGMGQAVGEDWIPWSLIFDLKDLPAIGDDHPDYPDWTVHEIQQFTPVGPRPSGGFDTINLCLCVRSEALAVA
jgi:hypothetical protein